MSFYYQSKLFLGTNHSSLAAHPHQPGAAVPGLLRPAHRPVGDAPGGPLLHQLLLVPGILGLHRVQHPVLDVDLSICWEHPAHIFGPLRGHLPAATLHQQGD